MLKKLPLAFVRREKIISLEQKNLHYEQEITFATNFVKEIESGNLESDYHDEKTESEQHTPLASSLLSMRKQMKKVKVEEKQRNWATEGFARFVDILRSENGSLKELADHIFSNLIKYLEVNQGALYLINDEDPQHSFIELITCYAYERKKYINRKIAFGEGLVGQVVLEKESIYMTDIPEKYVRITSGLGDALPRNLLIVPLKINEQVLGVIELASFAKIEDYKIKFVERLGESIASTISSAKVAQQTKHLLEESQQQAEEMKAQEEEMRQNMEELSATQEDMHRVMKEVQNKEHYLDELINASKDSIFTITKDFKLISYNKTYANSVSASGVSLEAGMDALQFFTEDEKPHYRALYERMFKGESFEMTHNFSSEGHDMYMSIYYAPLKDAEGNVTSGAVFARDVTENMVLQKNIEVREDVLGLTTILSESDPYGTITYVNKKFCEVSGYVEAELIGKPHNVLRHPDMPKELFKLLWTEIKKGEAFKGIIKNKTKSGGHYWVDATLMPVKDKTGKIYKYIGARYHITNDSMAEELYNEQAERLKLPVLKS